MRLILTNEMYPPLSIGGAEQSTARLAEGLASRGHEVIVLSTQWRASEVERSENLTVMRMPYFKDNHPGGDRAYLELYFPKWRRQFANFVAQKLEALKPDIVHAQNFLAIQPTFKASKKLNIPNVMSLRDVRGVCFVGRCFHESDEVPFCSLINQINCQKNYYKKDYVSLSKLSLLKGWMTFLLQYRQFKMTRSVLLKADALHFVGTKLKTTTFTQLPYAGITEVIHTIPEKNNSVAVAKKPENLPADISQKKIVLCLGKISEGKGIIQFIQSAKILSSKYPELLFIVVGRGDAGQYGFDEKQMPYMIQLSHQGRGEVTWLLENSFVMIQSSLCHEAYSRVILEAQAVGLPVIASDSGGNPESVQDNVNGFLYSRWNAEELAKKIETLLINPEKWAEFSKASKSKFVNAESEYDLLGHYEDLYKKVIHERKNN